MEITLAGQILIGIGVLTFGGWMLWISNSAVENKKNIAVMKESNNGVNADLTSITHQITTLGDDVKKEFKEFKDEMRRDINQVRNELSVFTKKEIDVLTELLNRERK